MSDKDKANALIFIRCHLHENLKIQYVTIKDHLVLEVKLRERYDHLKIVVVPQARYV